MFFILLLLMAVGFVQNTAPSLLPKFVTNIRRSSFRKNVPRPIKPSSIDYSSNAPYYVPKRHFAHNIIPAGSLKTEQRHGSSHQELNVAEFYVSKKNINEKYTIVFNEFVHFDPLLLKINFMDKIERDIKFFESALINMQKQYNELLERYPTELRYLKMNDFDLQNFPKTSEYLKKIELGFIDIPFGQFKIHETQMMKNSGDLKFLTSDEYALIIKYLGNAYVLKNLKISQKKLLDYIDECFEKIVSIKSLRNDLQVVEEKTKTFWGKFMLLLHGNINFKDIELKLKNVNKALENELYSLHIFISNEIIPLLESGAHLRGEPTIFGQKAKDVFD